MPTTAKEWTTKQRNLAAKDSSGYPASAKAGAAATASTQKKETPKKDAPSQEAFQFLAGPDNTVRWWSKKCEEVLQYESKEIVGKNWFEILIPDEYKQTLIDNWAAHGFDTKEHAMPLKAKDGRRMLAKLVPRTIKADTFFGCAGYTPLGPGPLGAGEQLDDLSSAWPFEVASVEGAGLGMMATRELEAGIVVFNEEPFFTRLQPSMIQNRKEWDADWNKSFERISAPLRLPGDTSKTETPLLASPALVRDALGFAKTSQNMKGTILGLSCPPLDLDHGLVEVSRQVAELCKRRLPECKEIDTKTLVAGILTTECNCFPGGRMFWTMSRVNHSCAPNCAFISSLGRWGLRTLRRIEAGEELSISYFNEELLYPTEKRKWLLWRSKCFVCGCPRCAAASDPLRDRPCVLCCSQGGVCWTVVHTPGVYCRSEPDTKARAKGFLKTGETIWTHPHVINTREGDWVQLGKPMDEEGAPRKFMLIHGRSIGLGELIKRGQVSATESLTHPGGALEKYSAFLGRPPTNVDYEIWYQPKDVQRFMLPAVALGDLGEEDVVTYAKFIDGCWRCPKCGAVEDDKDVLRVERILAQVVERICNSNVGIKSLTSEVSLTEDVFIMQTLQLLDDVGAVCGRRHWARKIAELFKVDVDLSLMQYSTNIRGTRAEFVERMLLSLVELWDWMTSLDLSQEPGCWLQTRVNRALSLCATHGALFCEEASRISEARRELAKRVELSTPIVDLLPVRNIIPSSQMSAG